MSNNKITPNNILHFNKNENKISLENLFDFASSANVADVLKNLYSFNGFIKDVVALKKDYKIVGTIRTVETNSNDWGTCIKAIYKCNPGEILFIKCSNDDYAVWGELASVAAKKNSLNGTIIYGCSRDTEDIIKINYPVFSRGIKSNAGYPFNNGNIGNKLFVDDLIIENGDIAVCDCDGVVIIPKKYLNDVLTELKNIKNFENDLKSKMASGEHLDNLLNL